MYLMHMDTGFNEPGQAPDDVAISLDGIPVELLAEHRSLNSIRCQLETIALEKQRVLCALNVDGRAASLALPLTHRGFSRVDAESIALDESELLVLKTALQQAQHARECVETVLTLVLINNRSVARELWWNLARQLKEPILTLSLLPDHLCGPANGGAPLKQLRKWQLEQIAAIIREVEKACQDGDTIQLSNALENRVLPWLQKLDELIQLWHETALAGSRLGIKDGAF
jgi:hypothetical protein